jgi:hypothetical protein
MQYIHVPNQIEKNIFHAYTILHRHSTFNLSKQTFCNITLKFQTSRTISNGNHFLDIYSFCVEDRKFKTGNIGYTRQRQTEQKHNTLQGSKLTLASRQIAG